MAADERAEFSGFDLPEQNWFRMPNNWTDITAGMKSLAELKIIEYVLRHTWGYQEYGISKRISIDEFMHGRRRQEGSRMDRGTGLSRQSVIDGVRNAVKHGFLIEHVNDRDKGRVQKAYSLRMKNLEAGVKILDPPVKNLHPRGLESSRRSEKDTQERNYTVTVNGNNNPASPLWHLPELGHAEDQVDLIATDILDQLGDRQSERFYRLVAQRVPEQVIYQALSEIKADGAQNPARVFTYRMNRYAIGATGPGQDAAA